PAQDDAVGWENGEGRSIVKAVLAAAPLVFCARPILEQSPDNTLTEAGTRDVCNLLFDGKSYTGWMNSDRTAPRNKIEDGTINPHGAGHYMVVHEKQWENFVITADFKISPKCNSGIF